MDHNTIRYLETEDQRKIACKVFYPKNKEISNNIKPGIVFLGGYRSDMSGKKACWIERWCYNNGYPCLLFEYTGHGNSSGFFEDCCIGDWIQDSIDVIQAYTKGKQILIGSSMGGWIALKIGKLLPQKVMGIIGVAAAPDFTNDLFKKCSAEQKERIHSGENIYVGDKDWGILLNKKIIEDGNKNSVLSEPYMAPFPVQLLQGGNDQTVSFSDTLKALEMIEGANIQARIVKNACHSFSDELCFKVIEESILSICENG